MWTWATECGGLEGGLEKFSHLAQICIAVKHGVQVLKSDNIHHKEPSVTRDYIGGMLLG